jgi:hypothetical protein
MSGPRAVLALLVLGATAWALVGVFREPPPPAAPRSFTSSQQCAECHADLYAEWKESQHAQSWINPEVRALSNDFSNTDCIDCHAPRAIFTTGIGNRVLPRSSRRNEGVDCIACHMLPDGRVAGTIDAPDAPCRPVAKRELARPEFCAGCHDQHETVKQWQSSRYAEEGIDCATCHLPYRNGDPNAGRDHGMWGGHDPELVESAVAFHKGEEGGVRFVEVENIAAGHSFPTDERSRAADVFWRPLVNGQGEGDWQHVYRFRSPYRHEVDVPDTLLLVHEKRRIDVPAEAEGPIELALFYARKPYWEDPDRPDPDREAQLLHRVSFTQ